jgi:phosphoglycolate phosphatase-like HAD superfamily hydrolase
MSALYIFDFDGVISNSFEIARQEINRLAQTRFPQLPYVESHDDMARLYPGPLKTSLRRFSLTDEESKMFFDMHSQAMVERAEEISAFDEVLEVITHCAAGRSSIVTSAYSQAVRAILSKSKHYRENTFISIMGRELCLPKSQKIAGLLRTTSIGAKSALHFGDMVSDLLYSREVQIPFCAVGWGYHPITYLKCFNPEFSVRSSEELRHLIHKWDA